MSCLEAPVLLAWIHVSLKTSVEETSCVFLTKNKKTTLDTPRTEIITYHGNVQQMKDPLNRSLPIGG
jgi:hypothetical protein